MNVLFLDQFSEMGGAQRCLLDLVPTIAERGGRLFAAIPGQGAVVASLREFGVNVSDIPCGPYRSGPKTAADMVRFALDVAKQARILHGILGRHRIDLIYANGPRLWPAAAFASSGRTPVVFHMHHHIGQNVQARIAGWATRRRNATVIACCEYAGSPLRRFLWDRVRVIRNGTADCGYRSRDFRSRGWRIGMIGRIAPEKGQLEFVKAVAGVPELQKHCRFIICGAPMFADSRYFEDVRNAAKGLPFEFTGWRQDINRVLDGLDVLVIGSSEEAMPRVMLEAFSAGVPVVAFDVGGIGEVIKDEVTGLLASDRSCGALGFRIGQAIADPERLRRIAGHARFAWEQFYTIGHYRRNIAREIDRAVAAGA